jgi:hypothetical protein
VSTEAIVYAVATAGQMAAVLVLGFSRWRAVERAEHAEQREEEAERRAYRESYLACFWMRNHAAVVRDLKRMEGRL